MARWHPQKLNGTVKGSQYGRNIVGDLFEAMVADLLDGRRWPGWPLIPIPREVARDDVGDDYLLQPDVFWPSESAMVEVKAGINKFYVTISQHQAYSWVRDQAKWPIAKPRVFYAFVAYRTEQKVGKRRSVQDLQEDAARNVQFVLIVDSRLLDLLLPSFGTEGRDWISPLSPMLGAWRDRYLVTPTKLSRLMSMSRTDLTDQFGSDWRVTDISGSVRIIRRHRRSRRWIGPLPFEQTDLFDPNRPIPRNDLDDYELLL